MTGDARDARWIRDAIIASLAAPAPAVLAEAEPAPPPKPPRHDPAFPAAFVFLSHSASFLAADLRVPPAGRLGPG